MRFTKLSLLAVAAVVASACGSSSTTSSDQLAAAVPDSDGLTLEATGAASEDATSSSLSASTVTPDAGTSGLEFLPAIRQGIADLNQGLQQFFTPIGQLIATQGTDIVVGTSKSYGPVVKGNVSYLLTVKRFATNRYAWKLEGKASDAAADVAFTTLAVGTLFHAESDEAHRGRGQIGIDLDAFATVSAGFLGQGKLYGAYSNYDVTSASGLAGDAKTLVYVLSNFSIDATAHAPISAAFVGHKTLLGVRDARVAYLGDLPQFVGTPTDHAELLLGRARFNPGVGGRADALVTGGDVPAAVIYGAECWDVSENLLWKKVWSCTSFATSSCTVLSEQGSVSTCAVDLQDAVPEAPTDGSSTSLDSGAPDPTVAPISTMPNFNTPT
jgi:hypothetical protein